MYPLSFPFSFSIIRPLLPGLLGAWIIGSVWGASFALSSVTRESAAGPPAEVVLHVLPPQDTVVYSVEEDVPSGVVPTGISEGGTFDRFARRIKWGPFTDGAPRELRARLISVDTALEPGGRASFNGAAPVATGGDSGLSLPDASSYFLGWQAKRFGVPERQGDFLFPSLSAGAESFPLLYRYAFGETSDDRAAGNSPHFEIDGSGSDEHLVFRFSRDSRREDVVLVMERSVDMKEWSPVSPAEYEESTFPIGQNREEYSLRFPKAQETAASGAVFYRIRIELEEF